MGRGPGQTVLLRSETFEGVTPSGTPKSLDLGGEAARAILFLTSSCLDCRRVWDALASMRRVPAGRFLVVTPDPSTEDSAALRSLAAPGVEVVMSSAAWLELCSQPAPWLVTVAGGRVIRSVMAPTSMRRLARLLRP